MTEVQEISSFERVKSALSHALRVDDVRAVRDEAQRMHLYARQAKDRSLMADATELRLRSERRLGELLIEVKEAGQLSVGGRKRQGAWPEGYIEPATLKEVGVDKKLSSEAQVLARKPEAEFEDLVTLNRRRVMAAGARVIDAEYVPVTPSDAYREIRLARPVLRVAVGQLPALIRLLQLVLDEGVPPNTQMPLRDMVSPRRLAQLAKQAEASL